MGEAIMLVIYDVQSIVYLSRVSLFVSLLNMFNSIDLLELVRRYMNPNVYSRLHYTYRVYYSLIFFLCALEFIINFSQRIKFWLFIMVKMIVLYLLMVLQIALKTNRLHLVKPPKK